MARGNKQAEEPVVEPEVSDTENGVATAVAEPPETSEEAPVSEEAVSEETPVEAAAEAETSEPAADAAVADLPPVDPEPDPLAPLDDQLLPGAVSIDSAGTRAAYLQNDVAGVPWLWLLDLGSGESMPVTPEHQERPYHFVEEPGGPQWSPDGEFLALTARYAGADRTHLRVVDVSTGVTAAVVDHPGSDSWPRWSPDGEWIAFVSEREGEQFISIASAQGDGPATQLTVPPPGQRDREPIWDIKGGRLAFLRTEPPTVSSQAGDHVWTFDLATGAEKQLTKKIVPRRSLRWGPTRPLILHVAKEADWDHIAVVNADNQAAWTISSEQGDKSEPQWSADGNRVLFIRSKNGVVNACDRATSAASSEVLDPGPGRAWSPRWLPAKGDQKLAFYAFSPATGGPRFYIQPNKKDSEREEAIAPGGWSAGERTLVAPSNLDFTLLKNLKTSGLFYRKAEGAGPAPAVILLGARPEAGPDAGYSAAAQALAATGLAVYAPILPGAAGAGRKLANARKDRADLESEVDDLLAVIDLLKANNGVDGSRIAIVGEGYGGALALVLAGSRPDAVQAAVAIDPIVDWDEALDAAEGSTRAWYLDVYGAPLANAGRYALRTPMTFAGVIEAPVLLIERTPKQIHLPLLRAKLDELGRPYWSEEAIGASGWAVYARAAGFLTSAFRGTLEAPGAESESAPAEELSSEALAAMIVESPVDGAFDPVAEIETIAVEETPAESETELVDEIAAPIIAAEAVFESVEESAETGEPVVDGAAAADPAAAADSTRPLVRPEEI